MRHAVKDQFIIPKFSLFAHIPEVATGSVTLKLAIFLFPVYSI